MRIRKAAGEVPRLVGWAALLLLGASLGLPSRGAEATGPVPGRGTELTLVDFVSLVLEHNETLQAQLLEAEVSHRKARAEGAIFEPDLSLSAERDWNKRINNSVQQSAAGGLLLFQEHNNIYDSALETLIPTGGKIRLGYTLSDLMNNLTNPISLGNIVNGGFTREYQSFAGVTFTQPLLKNGGVSATMANARLAALDSDIAFQQYRRQLMVSVSQAEAAYWNLYFAQEQLRFFEESVAVAQGVLADSQERLKAGQGSELEVMEAQSGLALRRTKHNDARQNYFEALGRALGLYGALPDATGPNLRALDTPPGTTGVLSYSERYHRALDLNPEYLTQLKKVDQERLKLGVARNQVLPELDFKAAYGFNGLGKSPADSWNMLESENYPSWSLGVELHVPVLGNLKGRYQLAAARLSLQESLVNLNSIETQIANAIQTGALKARTMEESVQSYQTVVRFNQDLLNTQLERLKVGKIEPRKVLEVEADLFEARQSLADALVRLRRILLEMELADGSVLDRRRLDITQRQLREKTTAMLEHRPPPTAKYDREPFPIPLRPTPPPAPPPPPPPRGPFFDTNIPPPSPALAPESPRPR